MIPTYKEICKKNNIKTQSRELALLEEFEKFILPHLDGFSCSSMTLHCDSKFLSIMDKIKCVYKESGWNIDYIVERWTGCEVGNTFRLTVSGIK